MIPEFNEPDNGLSKFSQFLENYVGAFGIGVSSCPIAKWLRELGYVAFCFHDGYIDIHHGETPKMPYPEWAENYVHYYDAYVKAEFERLGTNPRGEIIEVTASQARQFLSEVVKTK